MVEPTTLVEAVELFRKLTAKGVPAPEAAVTLCEEHPAIAEPWRVCTSVYRLAGAPYGDDPDSMARWFTERRG